MQYKLEFIQGLQEYAKNELLHYTPELTLEEIYPHAIIISTDIPFETLRGKFHLFKRIEILDTGFKAVMITEAWRKAVVPAGIHPSLAFVMCQMACLEDTVMLDPFCGAGTIPIIASRYFNPKTIIASDKSGIAMDKVAINAKEAHVKKGFMSFRSDIRRLKLGEKSVDRIITNMPFGIRVDSHVQNEQTYMDFFIKCGKILKPNGILIALTQEKKLFTDLFDHSSGEFQKMNELEVNTGGLKPFLYTYKKR